MLSEDDVSIDRVFLINGNTGPTRAFVSVRIGPIVIKGFRIVTAKDKESGEDYNFAANPSSPGKEGKYFDTVFIDDEDFNKSLKRKVMKAWYEAKKQQGDIAQS